MKQKLTPKISLGCKSCDKNLEFESSSNFKFSKPQYKQETIVTGKTYSSTRPSSKKTSLF